MIKQPVRLYTLVYGVFGGIQGISSLARSLYPSLDQTFPVLLVIPHMIPVHSTLHLVTAIVALVIFFRGEERSAFWFTFAFGLFYFGLGFAGLLSGHQFGLGLEPFDHPIHIFIGALGLLAATPTIYHAVVRKTVSP